MYWRDNLASKSTLVTSFAVFYAAVEFLFWRDFSLSNSGILGLFVLVLISFLNLVPAGVFAFGVVSLLPEKYSSKYNEKGLLESSPSHSNARLALLLTTYNDFVFEPAEYGLNEARRGGIAFFVLDDSNDASKRNEVDAFCEQFHCQLVRRNNRKGYKAGAVNEWANRYGEEFDYIFILDSDSRASKESIFHCLELAKRDPTLAVVQSKTLTMTSYPTRFTQSTVTIQHAYMEIVQKAMQKLGTSPYYGHNALIKLEALKAVGGFVEESNEDYKTLALMHKQGFRSIYAENAVTWEEVPPDYFGARKRALRWSRDAVTQPRLMKHDSPLAIRFYLLYGWVTHMSNVFLLAMILCHARSFFPETIQ